MTMTNLYLESRDTERRVSNLALNIHTLEVIKSCENTLELMAQRVFGYENDREFFEYLEGATKRMGVGQISKAITKVMRTKQPDNIQLIYLGTYTDEVFQEIKHFPSVIKLCGNAKDEAEYSLFEERRKDYYGALAHFIARHIFVYKLYLNSVINDQIRGAIDGFVERRDRTKILFQFGWQSAKTWKADGLDFKDISEKYINYSPLILRN